MTIQSQLLTACRRVNFPEVERITTRKREAFFEMEKQRFSSLIKSCFETLSKRETSIETALYGRVQQSQEDSDLFHTIKSIRIALRDLEEDYFNEEDDSPGYRPSSFSLSEFVVGKLS